MTTEKERARQERIKNAPWVLFALVVVIVVAELIVAAYQAATIQF